MSHPCFQNWNRKPDSPEVQTAMTKAKKSYLIISDVIISQWMQGLTVRPSRETVKQLHKLNIPHKRNLKTFFFFAFLHFCQTNCCVRLIDTIFALTLYHSSHIGKGTGDIKSILLGLSSV